ncbi:hypothetical protein GA0070609_5809 [Micromonospora echinaurantiaca]|uniref:Uncharacterized protein n=1 Tax=Micromonospora echinaurantiaca TaxID=47857 RepID=A0A1C5K8X8_9ACTN|nr:hypothetical protein [Micromonospora echinaurantiaca]SCG79184.1 hypothetical protein GA0070609_5809 [Micromonospora echinaurantiaca]
MTTDQSAAGGPQPADAPGAEGAADRAAKKPAAGGTDPGSGTGARETDGRTTDAGRAPGKAADGKAADGTSADGTSADGRAGNGGGGTDSTTSGRAERGKAESGNTAGSGRTAEAKAGDGKNADGTSADRKSVDGGSGRDKSDSTAAGKSGPGNTADDKTADDKGGPAETADGKSGASGTDGAKDGSGKTDGKDGSGKIDGAKDGPGKTDGKDGSGKTAGDKDGETDPFAAFAPAPEPVPTRVGRIGRAIGRGLIHEWTLATVGSLLLAVLLTWPTLRYPRHTLPQDYWDPSLQAWQMAWSGHILLTNPAQLWHANTFFPESWSFAFSDTLLGYAPAGMLGTGPEAAILRYNIIFVLAHALATLGAYALARQLGAGRIGAAVAGVSYAYAPWLLAQAGHLHVVSNGGIPLALAMLARGHGYSLRHGYRPERRHDGWVYAGWLVAAWQLSLGFGIGLPFAYFLGGTVVVAAVTWFLRRWVVRPVKRPFGRRLLLADLVGGAIFAGIGLLMALPYFKVAQLHPQAERTIGDISIFSPPAIGFFTAPAESRVWGSLHEGARATLPWHPEMTLLPGFVLYALAAGGLFFSVWKLRHRLLLLAGVVVTMVLAMGTRFFDGTFTYVPLFEHLPGWNGLRTPGRLMLWTTLLLGLLAAGAVSAFAARVREISAERIPSWPSPGLRLATLVPLLLVIVEGLNATPHPVVPPQPAAMRTVDGPLLVLPSNQSLDQPVMLWSTSRFQDVVNGGSGFTPHQLDEVRRVSAAFPDQTSVDYLRTLGVRNVLLMRDQVRGTPWEITIDAPVDGLDITREEIGQVVVFRL